MAHLASLASWRRRSKAPGGAAPELGASHQLPYSIVVYSVGAVCLFQ